MEEQTHPDSIVLTDDLKATIVEYRTEGMNIRHIAFKLQIPARAVRNFCHLYFSRISAPVNHRAQWTEEEERELMQLWRKGLMATSIANHFHRSPIAIRKRIQILQAKHKLNKRL